MEPSSPPHISVSIIVQYRPWPYTCFEWRLFVPEVRSFGYEGMAECLGFAGTLKVLLSHQYILMN